MKTALKIISSMVRPGLRAAALTALAALCFASQAPAGIDPSEADLAITKQPLTQGTILAGDEVLFLIQITNSGPSAATGVVVVDELPPEAAPDMASLPGNAIYDGPTNTVMWALDDIPAGETVDIVLDLVALEDPDCIIESGDFRTQTQGGYGARPRGENAASILHANFDTAFPGGATIGVGDCSGAAMTFFSAQDVQDFLPQGGPSGALPDGGNLAGQALALTISIGLDEALEDFGASDFHLADLTVVDQNSPCFGMTVAEVLAVANNVLAGCDTETDPSEIAECVDKINSNFVDGKMVGRFLGIEECTVAFCNVATVSADTFDPDQADNTSDEACVPFNQPEADITVDVVPSDDPIEVGETITLIIVVCNDGPDTAENVVIENILPDELIFLSGGADCVSTESHSVVCTIGDLAAGECVTMEVVAEAVEPGPDCDQGSEPDCVDGQVCIETQVVSDTADPDTSSNFAQTCIVILPGEGGGENPDLTLAMSATPEIVEQGENALFSIMVTNNGAGAATGIMLETVFPEGLTPVSGDGVISGENVLSDLGTLGPGESTSVSITATAAENVTGEFCAEATVSSNETDDNPADNTAQACVTVIEGIEPPDDNPDLVVSISATPEEVEQGASTLVTVEVVNAGPGEATGTSLLTVFPAGLTPVSGDGVISGENVLSDLGTLASGASATVTITAVADLDVVGVVCITATASADQPDENPADNTAMTCVNLEEPPLEEQIADVMVQIDDRVDAISRGAIQTYTIFVTNNGPDQAEGVVLTDILSEFTTILGVESEEGFPVMLVDDQPEITIGDLAPNQQVKVLVAALVHADAPVEISNTAMVSSVSIDTVPENNTDTELTTTAEPDEGDDTVRGAAILRHILGELNLKGLAHTYHDLNGDGVVNVADLVLTQN